MADVRFQEFADNTESSKSEEIRIALGIANAYREALKRKDAMNKRKLMLWRLLKNEIEAAAASGKGIDKFKERIEGASTAASNAPSDATWYDDFGPSEVDVRASIKERYPTFFEGSDGGDGGDGSGGGSSWWSKSEFTRFGRQVKRVQMECEFFAELLIQWVYFDGKERDEYPDHVYERMKGEVYPQGFPSHPCRFLRKFSQLSFSDQVGIIEELTERLHETQAGCEFFRLGLDCERSSPPFRQAPDLAGLWDMEFNSLTRQELVQLLHTEPSAATNPREKIIRQYTDYIRMMENSGFNLIYLFDHDKGSELNQRELAFKHPDKTVFYTVISDPRSDDPTFENGKITGEGDSEALGRIAKRMMVGATKEMGAVVNPQTQANVDIAKEFVSRPLGALLDAYFTKTFNEGVYGLTKAQITGMKNGDLSSVNSGSVSKLKRTKKVNKGEKGEVGEDTIEGYFQTGQTWLGYVESVSTGIGHFNTMIQDTRNFAESSDHVSDVINRMANPPPGMDVDDGHQALAKLVKNERWFERINRNVVAMSAVMTTLSTVSIVGEVVLLSEAGEKEWSFKDSLSIVSQLHDVYGTVNEVNGQLANLDEFEEASSVFGRVAKDGESVDEITELSDRGRVLLPKVVGESVGIIADAIDMGICAYQSHQRWEVGDTDGAIVKGAEGLFSAVGVGATIVGIIVGGPIAAVVGAAAALAALTVALISWMFGIEDTPIETWVVNSEFGTSTPGDTQNPSEPQYRANHLDPDIRLARQISWYLSIRMGFTVEFKEGVVFAPKVHLRADTKSMEISLENILRGSYDSDLIVCPIKSLGNTVQCPRHVISLGYNDTYDFQPSITVNAIHRNEDYMTQVSLSSDKYDPKWWDNEQGTVRADPKPPSQVWAWNGIFNAADVADLCAAGDSAFAGNAGSGKAAYDDTWGVELIHAFGGLDEDLRTLLQGSWDAPKEKWKKIARVVELLPYPRQRVGIKWDD